MSGFALTTGVDRPEAISRMLARLRHRGDDTAWADAGDVGLGTCNRSMPGLFSARLASAGGLHVLVEGQVEAEGDWLARYDTRTFPEALALAFRREGPESLARLRGAFVVVVVSAGGAHVSVIRDPLGLRPVYFWATRDELVAASEAKAVLAHSAVPRSLDPAVLGHLLVIGLEPSDRSLAQGVRKLPPGHLLTYRRGEGASTRPVIRLVVPVEPLSQAGAVERLEHALTQGMRERLGDSIPVGLFLSGGVDSYVLGECLVRLFPGRVTAGTTGVGAGAMSEFAAAAAYARRLRVTHVTACWPPPDQRGTDLATLLARAVERTEQPGRYANAPLLQHLLSRWPAPPPVFVTGDAADGLFGDGGCRRLMRIRRLRRVPGIRRVGQLAARLGSEPGGRPAALARLCLTEPGAFHLFVPEVFVHSPARALLGFDPVDDVQAHYDFLAGEVPDATPAQRYSYLYLRGAAQGYIDKLERLTAAAGADLLHPFLFPAVVELALSLPDTLRFRRGRAKPVVVGLALRTAPRSMVLREKLGFGVPRVTWLQRDASLGDVLATLAGPDSVLGGYVDRAALANAVEVFRRTGGGGYQDALWILVSAELWARALLCP